MGRFFVATLLYGSFALQLLLAGRGATCVMSDGGSMDSPATAAAAIAMAGKDMPMDMRMPSGGTVPAPTDGQAPSNMPSRFPCDQPATPASCQLMAPCAASFIGMLPVVSDSEARTLSRILVTPALEPASHTYPPDIPPPRA